jgi:hypothetical protein
LGRFLPDLAFVDIDDFLHALKGFSVFDKIIDTDEDAPGGEIFSVVAALL